MQNTFSEMTHMLTLCDHKQHFVSLKAALQAFRIAVDEAQLTFVAASWCERELPQMQCMCVIQCCGVVGGRYLMPSKMISRTSCAAS